MANGSTGEAAVELWRASPPDSEIRFSFSHLVLLEISGVVRRWHAVLGIDRDRPERSAIEVAIDAASIETGSLERDAHLRSAEFLDVAAYPEIRFRSTEVRPDDRVPGRFVILGDLQVKDLTREIVLVGERDPGGDPERELSFVARTMVDRQEMRLHWNQDLDRGGVVAGDKIDLQIRLRARPFGAGVEAGAPASG